MSDEQRGGLAVEIDYTNYRGERAPRTVLPIGIYFGATEQHPEEQWLMRAHAMDRGGAIRDFAMCDIHSWREIPFT